MSKKSDNNSVIVKAEAWSAEEASTRKKSVFYTRKMAVDADGSRRATQARVGYMF